VNHPFSDWIIDDWLIDDWLFCNHESLSIAIASSIGGRIAFTLNEGKKMTRIEPAFDFSEDSPLVKGHSHFSINSFSFMGNPAANKLTFTNRASHP